MFFTFPEDAHWNAEHQAVEFGVEIGKYRGVVRVLGRVFQRLLPERPTPERPRSRKTRLVKMARLLRERRDAAELGRACGQHMARA